MASSVRKDIFQVFATHSVPPDLSKEEFEAKFDAYLDDVLAPQNVRRNFLKYEVLRQNDRFDEYLESYGCIPREPMVVVRAQAESPDHIISVLADPEVQRKCEAAESFGLQTGARVFSVDAEQVIDRISSVAPENRVHLVCIYKVPENISPEQYGKGVSKFLDDWAALPTVQKNFMKLQKCFPNVAMDAHIDKVGYSQPEPAFIAHLELETWDNVVDFQTDEARKLVLDANRDFGLGDRCCIFTADLITKI
ncbi:hypothetical protein K438DRAFT_1847264 [Mycena galopus ATCC 62051]|nr:hypothetical protein K438DRAFT_1847264 [Mycena galopus ATCC 62051]